MGIFSQSIRPSIFSSETFGFVCKTCHRNAASFRRTRKVLRVKNNDAFAPSQAEPQDHILFNPPSSAPNVYHTPLKFLPTSDPRRSLLAKTSVDVLPTPGPKSALAAIAAARLAQQPAQRFPAVREEYQKQYHLKPEQIEEIRRLRSEDPRRWTVRRLAAKFECSEFFIAICSKSPAMKAEHEANLASVKRRWGRRKTEAREDRQERKKLWGMDA